MGQLAQSGPEMDRQGVKGVFFWLCFFHGFALRLGICFSIIYRNHVDMHPEMVDFLLED